MGAPTRPSRAPKRRFLKGRFLGGGRVPSQSKPNQIGRFLQLYFL